MGDSYIKAAGRLAATPALVRALHVACDGDGQAARLVLESLTSIDGVRSCMRVLWRVWAVSVGFGQSYYPMLQLR